MGGRGGRQGGVFKSISEKGYSI